MTNKIAMTNAQRGGMISWSLVNGHLLVIGIWALVIRPSDSSGLSQRPAPPVYFSGPSV